MQRIGFNDTYGLTAAVLTGRKTMTRRIEKCLDKLYAAEKELGEPLEIYQQGITREGIVLLTNAEIIVLHTNYKIDEEVAVKASGRDIYRQLQQRYGNTSDAALGFKEMHEGLAFWTNKMFTPADLCPDHIIITGLRIERLQDISDEDCMKEGIYRWKDMEDCPKSLSEIQRNRFGYYGVWDAFSTPRKAFADLIDKPGVGGKGTWERNPWVFAYSFKKIK